MWHSNLSKHLLFLWKTSVFQISMHICYTMGIPWTSSDCAQTLSVKKKKSSEGTASFNYFSWSYLFLFSEFYFHLLVTRLILANAMSSYKIATDVSQFWILFTSFFYQPKNITCVFRSHKPKNGRQSFVYNNYVKKKEVETWKVCILLAHKLALDFFKKTNF